MRKVGLTFWAEPDEDEFAADIPRDPKSVTVLTTSFPAHLFRTSDLGISDPELRDASVLVLCLLMRDSEFVVVFVKVLTEVGKFGEI